MNFLKNILSSFIGSVLAILIGGFLFIALAIGAVALMINSVEATDTTITGKHKMLHLSLNNEVVEFKKPSPFDDLELPGIFGATSQDGLIQLFAAIDKAATDDEIKGVFLNLSGITAGYAQVKELRDHLLAFKTKSDKPIFAYSEVLSEKAYYLASVADKLYMMPEGMLEFRGLSIDRMYYKNLMEKLEVRPKIFRVGQFKSAVEPFLRENMSDANRTQLREFSESLYGEVLKEIALSRNLDATILRTISDELKVRKVSDAVSFGLIDAAIYQDEAIAEIKAALTIEGEDKINFVTPTTYLKGTVQNTSTGQIAVVIAEGEIISGKSIDGYLGSTSFAKDLKKAQEDDNIKAIVVRINSPGGSAMASDVMWRAIRQAAQSKPVIASMSTLAASGGYYMAMACDSIVAEPLTITGSIGVFGVLFEIDEFLKNKLGITTDRENTGKFSDMGSPTRKMTPLDSAIIQTEVNRIYEVFTTKAAESRGMSVEKLKSYAGGRVWSGVEAKQIGLVDELGGLDRAIAIAAGKVGLVDYDVQYISEDRSFFDKITSDYSSSISERMLKEKIGADNYQYLQLIEQVKRFQGVRASLPYDLKID